MIAQYIYYIFDIYIYYQLNIMWRMGLSLKFHFKLFAAKRIMRGIIHSFMDPFDWINELSVAFIYIAGPV